MLMVEAGDIAWTGLENLHWWDMFGLWGSDVFLAENLAS